MNGTFLFSALAVLTTVGELAAATDCFVPSKPDLALKSEIVITNAIGRWPDGKKADRLFFEIENLDEANGEVVSVQASGVVASGKEKGRPKKVDLRQRFYLPDGGRGTFVLARRELNALAASNLVIRIRLEKNVEKHFGVRRVLFLAPKEKPPAVDATPRRNRQEEREHGVALKWFRDECGEGGLAVGVVSSMEAVRPRARIAAKVSEEARLCVARNESESVQVLVSSVTGDLKDARVEFAPLKSADGIFAAENLKCSPVGYVETKHPAPYVVRPKAVRPAAGWWPDAILDFTNRTDIAEGDVQSFWIRVKCPKGQKAGVYKGAMTVRATQGGTELSRTLPLSVRVNGFELPDGSMLPLAITFGPGVYVRGGCCKEGATCIHNAWKTHVRRYADFLADYYITWDSLYINGGREPNWEALKILRDEGRLGQFNLHYYWYSGVGGEKGFLASEGTKYRKQYDKAKELGLLDYAYFYGCDELGSDIFKNLAYTVDVMHREYPGVKLMTTCRDGKLGVDGSVITNMDIFCPASCFWDPKQVNKSRAAGHQVYWYFCCDPTYPFANTMVETPPIEIRSFMGAQSVKYRPDGFLYYETAAWKGNSPIMRTFYDWDARTFGDYHGDGQWTCCGGPDMLPLPTLRLENFRDGLEDYAYAKILEAKLAACRDTGCVWAVKARTALAVPSTLVKSLSDFSIDPAVLYAWRNSLADLIESSPCGRK